MCYYDKANTVGQLRMRSPLSQHLLHSQNQNRANGRFLLLATVKPTLKAPLDDRLAPCMQQAHLPSSLSAIVYVAAFLAAQKYCFDSISRSHGLQRLLNHPTGLALTSFLQRRNDQDLNEAVLSIRFHTTENSPHYQITAACPADSGFNLFVVEKILGLSLD